MMMRHYKEQLRKQKRLYATFDQPKRNQKIQTYCVRKGFNISAIKEVLEGKMNEN